MNVNKLTKSTTGLVVDKTKTMYQRLTKYFSILVLVLLVVSPVSALAQSSSDYQNEINSLNAEIARKEAELGNISSQADTLENKLRIIEAEINSLQSQINKANAEISLTKNQIEEAIARLQKQKGIMFENARVLYKMGNPSTIEILASSDNFSEFINRQEYLETVKDAVNQAAQEIISLKAELEKKQSELERHILELRTKQGLVQSKRDEQATLLAQTRGQEAKYQNLVQSLKKQKQKAEADLVASLSSGSYKVSPVGQVAGGSVVGGVGNTGLSSGPHLHLEVRVGGSHTDPAPYVKHDPVKPPVVTQPYGNSDPIYTSGRHPGVDYGASSGSPIYAIDSGYLYRGCSDQLLGTSNNAYGYVAIVEHSGGHVSVYAHMSGGPSACNYNTYY